MENSGRFYSGLDAAYSKEKNSKCQNMHGEGWKTSDGEMLSCHKATSKKDFDLLMTAWKLKHPPSAAYADSIDHERWTS
ncbi:hypothetical protein B484DRAFT_402667 [Ochromonadaceae sp. CCMP2298]|nr:hypothetical protein B484DRAFT_402667 [Ochromonadaceae sp. CCMP2298]